MSHNTKQRITISVFALAAAAVALALYLNPGEDQVTTVVRRPTPPTPSPLPPEPPPPPEPTTPPEPQVQPKVDVVFVLDTTGSMAGLIAGAKRKIWSIANQIVSGQPRPHVRIGLIGYRDIGDAYVTRRYSLTEDMDDVYAHLQRFRADGGGDTPEHVNRALNEALTQMDWRGGQGVLRQIFLVGDAPPHEGRDGLTSRALARRAAAQGIVINAVRCGHMSSTAAAWRRIAVAAGGTYTSIRQDGGMVAVRSPYDDRLRKLNEELSSTVLPTGSARAKAATRRRARVNASMDSLAQAESAKYRAKTGRLDSNDLLTVLGRGKALSDLDDETLPPAMAGMAEGERKAYVAQVTKKRAALRKEISRLSSKRDAFVRKHKPKSKDSFDRSVGAALKAQGKAAGIAY